jgi:hypothetical protein
VHVVVAGYWFQILEIIVTIIMPAFSFTAPYLTPEEEKAERDSLTPETRQEVQNDMFGLKKKDGTEETDELIAIKLKELEQVIEKTPASCKTDYLDAHERAPHLVETEASPLKFLRCEHYDARVRR